MKSTNYHSKFIKNFSKIAGALSDLLTKEDKILRWSEACNAAINELKQLFSMAYVLKYL